MVNISLVYSEFHVKRVVVAPTNPPGKFTCSIALAGINEYLGTFATADTPDLALQRAYENLSCPERWRTLKF